MANEEVLAQLALAQTAIGNAVKLLNAPPATGSIVVKPSDNLLSILASAPANATVLVDPGFVLEADVNITKPVMLLTQSAMSLARVDGSLRGPTLRGALTLGPQVSISGFRLEGKIADQTIVTTGPGSILDRCVIHGSPAGQHRGVRADNVGVSISKCYIDNIWKDQDTQAIAAWDGCRNLLVDDCYLEASGENVLFGGEDAATEAGIPQDIIIQGCTMFKPLSWIGRAEVGAKNLFETKCVKRLTVRNCKMENSWVKGQTGYGMLINVRNQNGKALWSTTEDVLIEDCTINNVCNGIQILGRDYTNPSQTMKRVTLRRIAVTNIGTTWPGGAPGGWQIFISNGPQDLTLDGITFSGKIEPEGSAIYFDAPAFKLTNLVIQNCKFLEGFYGIKGTEAPQQGKGTLEMYAPGYVWKNNTIIKGTNTVQYPITYPPGTIIV